MTGYGPDKNPRLSRFLAEYDAASKHQNTYALRWKEFEKVYLGTPADRVPNRRSQAKRSAEDRYEPPYVMEQIETMKPRVIEPEPEFDWTPVEPSDNADSLRRTACLISDQFIKDSLVAKQEDLAHDGFLKGGFCAKIVWEHAEKTIKFNRKLNKMQLFAGLSREVEKRIVIANRPTMIRVDLNDFMWDPAATSDRNWRYVFHRSWLTDDDLKQRVKDGLYDPTQVEKLLSQAQNAGDMESRFYTETQDSARERRSRHEVVERWAYEGDRVTLMVVGGRCAVLRDQDSPFWHGRIPFVFDCFMRLPDDLLGIAEVSTIAGTQRLLWDMDNDQRDAVKKGLNPPFKYRRNMKGGKDFRIIPDGRIGVDRMDDIEQIQIDSSGVWGREDTQFLLGRLQSITGATPYMSGADSSAGGFGQDTATGVSILSQQAGQRMMLKQLHMHEFLSRVATFFLQLNQQFLTDDQAVRVAGGQIVKVPLEEIAQALDARPKWSSVAANDQTHRQSTLELLNAMAPYFGRPLAGGKLLREDVFIDAALKAHKFETDDAYIVMPPPGMTEAPPGAQLQAGDLVLDEPQEEAVAAG